MGVEESSLPSVSVVIATRRGGELLERCVDSVLDQDYPKSKYEVIVVSDVPGVMAMERNHPPVRAVSAYVKPGAKRNLGAREARGEILAFCDDDVVVGRNWLRRLALHFTDDEVGVVGGVNLTPPDATLREQCSGYVLSSFLGSLAMRSRYTPDVSSPRAASEIDLISCNMAVRKEVHERTGGFPEDLWPNEENVFCHVVGKAGYRLVYDPHAVVWHRRRPLFVHHVRQVMRSGWGRAQMMKMHPDSIRAIFFLPLILVAGLLLGAPLSLVSATARAVYAAALLSYLAIITLVSARIAHREVDLRAFFLLPPAFLLHHCAYGIGLLIGLVSRRGRE